MDTKSISVLRNPEPPLFFRKPFIIAAAVLLFIVIILILNYIRSLPAKPKVIAEVNGEKIYLAEYEAAKGLFSADPQVKKAALDFIIDRRLLTKEAESRAIDVTQTTSNRLQASIAQYGDEKNLEKGVNTDIATYQNFLTYQAIKEVLISSAIKWKVIDVFSIRYLYDDNAPPEEKKYKEVADKKIQEYYTKIKNGLDIREAIKERCKDPQINFLPYQTDTKVYTTSFNGTTCREQEVNLRISKDTNQLWGEQWLKQIFETTKKGEVSSIIDFTNKNVGIYFIVKVLDEGGDIFSIDELIDNLKKSAKIKVYLNI